MSKIKWDASGERYYENGVSHGVLYPKTGTNGAYENGVAWNGLTSISESPEGGEPNALYADNIKYLNLMSVEEFSYSIEAYTYPVEFGVCDGSIRFTYEESDTVAESGLEITGQKRKPFGLCYRTEISNDLDAEEYKIHIVYESLVTPSEKSYETINDSPDAITFSWDASTTPIQFEINNKEYSTSHIIVDSRYADKTNLKALEGYLYGTDPAGSDQGTDPVLLTPEQVYAVLSGETITL